MFIAINNNKYKKSVLFDMIHVKKLQHRITAHYCNVVHGHKGFVLTAVTNCFKPEFTLVT